MAVLNACKRRARGAECVCRFDANEIAEDATELGCAALADALEIDLEPQEVAAMLGDLDSCLADPDGHADDDVYERLEAVRARLAQVVEHGAALTDRYSDDIDP